jgi:hypothetical protein
MIMKTHDKPRALTLGEFIAGCNRAWGRQRAIGFIRLAAKAHLILFQKTIRRNPGGAA